jgi:hypothetical protein
MRILFRVDGGSSLWNFDWHIRGPHIWILPLEWQPDPDPGGQNILKKRKGNKYVKCWMFPLEGWRILLLLGRPSWRPRATYCILQLSVKINRKVKYMYLDPNPERDPDADPHWPKMLNRSDTHWTKFAGFLPVSASKPMRVHTTYWTGSFSGPQKIT